MPAPEGQSEPAATDSFSNADLVAMQEDLAELARHLFHAENPGHTLQPTALVNELWIRLLSDSKVEIRSCIEFLAWASTAMRHLLVDHARRKQALKRGGGASRVSMADGAAFAGMDFLELDEALESLEKRHARSAAVVVMRFFGGMTEAEVAERLGVTDRTVRADWSLAKAWLYRALGEPGRR